MTSLAYHCCPSSHCISLFVKAKGTYFTSELTTAMRCHLPLISLRKYCRNRSNSSGFMFSTPIIPEGKVASAKNVLFHAALLISELRILSMLCRGDQPYTLYDRWYCMK